MTLVYQDPQSPSPDRIYQGRVQLAEVTHKFSYTSVTFLKTELGGNRSWLDGKQHIGEFAPHYFSVLF